MSFIFVIIRIFDVLDSFERENLAILQGLEPRRRGLYLFISLFFELSELFLGTVNRVGFLRFRGPALRYSHPDLDTEPNENAASSS